MDDNTSRVLFVEDDKNFQKIINSSAQRNIPDCDWNFATNPAEAIELATTYRPEVIVLDMCIIPGRVRSGLELIPKLLEIDDTMRIIMLSSLDDQAMSSECIAAGAANYVSKAERQEELFTLVRSSMRSARLLRAAAEVGASAKVVTELGLVTKSRAMAEVLDDIALAAMNDQPVMLFGETGVGKSYVAKLIHMASKRSAREFVECQPTFASRDLVMSELFGHVKGAFTGASDNRQGLIERANGGSLFLDEIDQYPHEVQVALLHVLQTKEYRPLGSNQIKTSDFRLISATNYPEGELFDQKQMRLDFYHRIAKLQILLPPLRKRIQDIPDIAGAILAQKVAAEGKEKMYFSRQAIHWLISQKWPGNIRELESTVERGFYQAMRAGSIAINISDMRRISYEPPAEDETTLAGQLKAYAYAVACAEFSRQEANHSATARALGIDRKRLRRILDRAEQC